MSLPWFFAADHLVAAISSLAIGPTAFDSAGAPPAGSGGRLYFQARSVSPSVKSVPSTATIAIGWRGVNANFTTAGPMVGLHVQGVTNAVVTVGSTGASGFLRITANGTNYDSTVPLSNSLTYYEVHAVCHATTGSVSVQIDGTVVFSVDNINTIGAGSVGYDKITYWVSSGSTVSIFSDVYIREAPSEGNPFYGPILLRYLRPVSDDAAVWTPTGSGTGNWGRVADASGHDGNTSYVETTTPGNEDVYNIADLPVGANSIIAVVPVTVAIAPSGGAPQVDLGLTTSGGTVYTGAQTVGVSTYQTQLGVAQTEKPGGGGWSVAAVNELKLRVKAV
jgi:hypothetical protein